MSGREKKQQRISNLTNRFTPIKNISSNFGILHVTNSVCATLIWLSKSLEGNFEQLYFMVQASTFLQLNSNLTFVYQQTFAASRTVYKSPYFNWRKENLCLSCAELLKMNKNTMLNIKRFMIWKYMYSTVTFVTKLATPTFYREPHIAVGCSHPSISPSLHKSFKEVLA